VVRGSLESKLAVEDGAGGRSRIRQNRLGGRILEAEGVIEGVISPKFVIHV
jgi:hypothetical protein